MADDAAKAAKDADAIVRGMSTSYRKEGEGRARAAEYAVMSESGRQYAQVMDKIKDSERAASEALNLRFPTEAEKQSVAYKKAVEDITKAHGEAERSAATWASEQDRLNKSWENGANRAMNSYLDKLDGLRDKRVAVVLTSGSGLGAGRCFKNDALIR